MTHYDHDDHTTNTTHEQARNLRAHARELMRAICRGAPVFETDPETLGSDPADVLADQRLCWADQDIRRRFPGGGCPPHEYAHALASELNGAAIEMRQRRENKRRRGPAA